MCLIAHVKAGQKIPYEYFEAAHVANNDGIGIMSSAGVEKYLGRKMLKKAWKHAGMLMDSGLPFAVHFRFATHGNVRTQNVHPFVSPKGDFYVMHNGVLHGHYTDASKAGGFEHTDSYYLTQDLSDGVAFTDAEYWKQVEDAIGANNKLCIMSRAGEFLIVNEKAGKWKDGVWYSQTYSLPDSFHGYSRKAYIGTGRQSLVPYETKWSDGYNRTLMDAYNRRYGAYNQDDAYAERVYCTVCRTWGDCSCKEQSTVSQEDTLIDAAVAEAMREDTYVQEGDCICASCETIYDSRKQSMANGHTRCPNCGFIDMNDGMLEYAGVVQKCQP